MGRGGATGWKEEQRCGTVGIRVRSCGGGPAPVGVRHGDGGALWFGRAEEQQDQRGAGDTRACM